MHTTEWQKFYTKPNQTREIVFVQYVQVTVFLSSSWSQIFLNKGKNKVYNEIHSQFNSNLSREDNHVIISFCFYSFSSSKCYVTDAAAVCVYFSCFVCWWVTHSTATRIIEVWWSSINSFLDADSIKFSMLFTHQCCCPPCWMCWSSSMVVVCSTRV